MQPSIRPVDSNSGSVTESTDHVGWNAFICRIDDRSESSVEAEGTFYQPLLRLADTCRLEENKEGGSDQGIKQLPDLRMTSAAGTVSQWR